MVQPDYMISMLWPDPMSVGANFLGIFQELTQSKIRETFSTIHSNVTVATEMKTAMWLCVY